MLIFIVILSVYVDYTGYFVLLLFKLVCTLYRGKNYLVEIRLGFYKIVQFCTMKCVVCVLWDCEIYTIHVLLIVSNSIKYIVYWQSAQNVRTIAFLAFIHVIKLIKHLFENSQ